MTLDQIMSHGQMVFQRAEKREAFGTVRALLQVSCAVFVFQVNFQGKSTFEVPLAWPAFEVKILVLQTTPGVVFSV